MIPSYFQNFILLGFKSHKISKYQLTNNLNVFQTNRQSFKVTQKFEKRASKTDAISGNRVFARYIVNR